MYNVDELLIKYYNINKIQIKYLKYIITQSPCDIECLQKQFNQDRTTIQKNIKKLMNVGLLKRYQENQHRGGYKFNYIVNDLDNIKNYIKSKYIIEYNIMISKIDEFII